MNIYEYQAKEILKLRGIPVPEGVIVDNLKGGLAASEKLGFPLAVKAQVHAGGRGKAGAIRIVSDTQELEKEMPRILAMSVKGLKVRKVLIEKAVRIKKQYYLGITVDRSRQCNALAVSEEGGIEIEEVAQRSPEKVSLLLLKASSPFEKEISEFIFSLALSDSARKPFTNIAQLLCKTYLDIDAQLAEINPLVLTEENEWIACDAKMVIDDNALFRHEDMKNLKEEAEENELETEAHKRGLAYVKLSGNIGIIGNGAGLVMATMDEVKRVGGHPANFLDIGGGAKREIIQNALEVLYRDREVEGIFINVFGGITRCDEVAKGIIEATKGISRSLPIVLRLTGTRAEEGRIILEESKLIFATTMTEGARQIVSMVGEKK